MDNATSDVNPTTLARMRAEALTLRAYFTHWLWKAHGNIPYFDKAWTEEPFLAPQHTFAELYPKMIKDLDDAIATPEFPLAATGALTGRVSKAMAMMTKARIVMYFKDQSKYAEVLADMKTIINSGSWSLILTAGNVTSTAATTNPIEWMYLREGEFCSESIFEVNHYANSTGKGWGNAWAGFGSYTPCFSGPRDVVGSIAPFEAGWGFCKVVPEAYAIFEDADYRKDASVLEVNSNATYQNTGLSLKKYMARVGYNIGTSGDRPLNYENNKRIYRLAETYLNAAELAVYAGDNATAQEYLDIVRSRAYNGAAPALTATLDNIKLERHREFFGEGMRFWDLVRWGSDENGTDIVNVLSTTKYEVNRTWSDNKKFLPIPQNEIDKTKGTIYELVQNPY
jgi:hypothetical protein